MLSFVPFHLCPVACQPMLKEWVSSWASTQDPLLWVEPKEWFLAGHRSRSGVWPLPPAAADVGLEKRAKEELKHPHNKHKVLIPCFMTGHWRKLLGKI